VRPIGVAALAVLTAAAGVATLVRAVWEPFRTLVDGSVIGASWLAPVGLKAPPDGVVGALLGAAFMASGVGLFALRPWAWWLAAIVGAVGLILSFGAVVWMAVWAGLLVYLVVVHEAFSAYRLTSRPTVT
jgi:hypothetical protein